jgi:hypothetical protein
MMNRRAAASRGSSPSHRSPIVSSFLFSLLGVLGITVLLFGGVVMTARLILGK